ncbi:3-isopropylmalate dehydratase large subunit [Chiayiivirga flava]|uniref:3-isopropylmalate dehydratase large subunit n=1 Tax=Chiayiivirga flava TaxID=659595 RepID=A0A7W8DAR0_9GAMM|nr:3-isopropylmalate dehydratase large subunit [Chiayiivirga flava]MBB5209283.1 3-isopropylmalate/(R)-2-methylmalate dehydratase large subunit [Chiayiivirga flava]
MTTPRTIIEKIWDAHAVREETADAPAILYIDLHLVHEVTTPQAFAELRERNLPVRRPDRTLATLDHSTPTLPPNPDGSLPYDNAATAEQVATMERNCADFGITLHGFGSGQRGVVHVMGPELGATQPGMTIVCGDSHTATHGAFGALAFGIGTTEVGHVLATQCLLQQRPKTLAVTVNGTLPPNVGAKDLILHIIGRLGMDGGTGHVIEYRGEAIRALSMEGRMTLCNMSIEAGARAGLVAPDLATFDYLRGRPHAPQGAAFDAAVERWKTFTSDDGATFDRELIVDAADVAPTVTWGTNPGQVVAIDGIVPRADDALTQRALDYMQFHGDAPLLGEHVDVVFIGSCTNGRISDLREAAGVLRGRHVASHVRMLVVPGSDAVKRQAEAEGLHHIVRAAGAEWREPGCSMCIGMNGDRVAAGQLAVSTSNRNFEGRQGKGARTVLASPATAAAAAVAGVIADPRNYPPLPADTHEAAA